MNKAYVLGSINKDFTYKVNRLPQVGETLKAESLKVTTGGKGANQAVAIARNDIKTSLIGYVGKNDEGIIDELKGYGVNTDFVKVSKENPTGTATIILTNGENSIIHNQGANQEVNTIQVRQALASAKPGDYFVTQLEINLDVVQYGLFLAKEKGMITFLNPSPAVTLPQEIYQHVDYLVLNEIEVEQLSLSKPLTDIEIYDIYKYFTGYGVKNVILTLGSEGACYLDGEDLYTMPARKVDVKDTTGAGDTFLGGFVSALAYDVPLKESVVYANYAAALACQVEGALESIPKKVYVMELIKRDQEKDQLETEEEVEEFEH